jgi:hypothetical protein
LDHGIKEGHGDESESAVPRPTKGTFIDGGGTYTPLNHTGISSNKKSGEPGGVKPLS